MGRDWRDDRIAELEGKLAAALARISTLEAALAKTAALDAKFEAALTKIAALEEKLRLSSRNSSKPPSSDPPSAPKPPAKKPSGRKPGGQPGHEGHQRALVPANEVNKRVPCLPDRCRRCHAGLTGCDASPRLHQVFELPKVKPFVTQYELHALVCSSCGTRTAAELPDGVPAGAFGPSVTAVVALLMGVYRLGKRPVEMLMADLYGLTMCVGSVVSCQEQAAIALEAPHAEAHAYVMAQPVKHADETGWREARARAWLWTAVTSFVTVFLVQARRNTDAARALLGDVCGVLITDRWGAYGWWPDLARQLCWAHLKRDFIKIQERGGQDAILATALLAERDQMFVWWHRVRDGTLARSTFRRYMKPLQDRVYHLLGDGMEHGSPKTMETCRLLRKHADALWTFVYREGVEPTNNAAELRIRHAVLWRKTSYGTHSPEGSRFVERVLTVHATLRQQNRSVLDFLHDACVAALNHAPPPSLLPQRPSAASAMLAHAA